MTSNTTDQLSGPVPSAAIKTPCVTVTTANITLEGEQTINSVAVVDGDRVLVKDQTDANENGIYVVAEGAWSRAKDFDGSNDVRQGTLIKIANGGLYELTTADPVDFDTDNITFEQSFSSDDLSSQSITARLMAGSALSAAVGMINGTLSASVAGSALTISLKTAAGTDPSSTDPVLFIFNSSSSDGSSTAVRVTSALSVTVSSGSTMGTSANVSFRLWVVAFNDAGTVRLGVINCLSGTSIYPLREAGTYSSTAEGGAGAADSAHVFYSTVAVTSKALRILGYATYTGGLATPGTWASGPTAVVLFGHGMSLPGMVVQEAVSTSGASATGTTTLPFDNTTPQNTEGNQFMSQAITPRSGANILEIEHRGYYAHSAATDAYISAALFQDSTAAALAAAFGGRNASANSGTSVNLRHRLLASAATATTFYIRAGCNAAGTTTFNGSGGAGIFNTLIPSSLIVREIMA